MKRTLLAIIGAALILFILHPIITAARYKEEPQLFINYEQFHRPIKENKEDENAAVARKAGVSQQPQTTAYGGRHYSKEEVQALIIHYADLYGLPIEVPLCIARLESGYNQFAANSSSSARGVFQYLAGTWKGTDEGKAGLHVFDADANVKAAIKYMAIHKNTRPWVVHTKCPTLKFL